MSAPGRPRRARLDQILVERSLADSRARAQALILAGRVRRGTEVLLKPGLRYPPDVELTVVEGRRWVGRGAHKLHAALAAFSVDVAGRDCIDVGASTGGFTQVLLEAGARRVIALDVGRGQLDWGLRNDDRVVVVEGLNARYLRAQDLAFEPSLAVVDVSFISLRLVLPPVVAVLPPSPEADLVALVKPQFEVGRAAVGRGGIVRDTRRHREVLDRTIEFCVGRGWGVLGVTASPIAGADGNREFLIHVRPAGSGADRAKLDRAVEAALVSSSEREVSG